MTKITTHRKKAWKWFSKYIRKKDANFDGYVSCITCGTKKKWKNMDAGHFIHGVSKMTYFEENNVHPQCQRCNKWLNGNLREYTLKMIDKYGRDEVERLKKLSHSKKTWNKGRLKELEEEYKQKFKDLNKEIDL